MQDEDRDEIKRLLQEIRDLQKAHFERYVAFTEQVLASDKQARDEAARANVEHDAFLHDQLAYQEEMRQAVRASQRNAMIGLAIIVGLLLVSLFGFVVLDSLLSGPIPPIPDI